MKTLTALTISVFGLFTSHVCLADSAESHYSQASKHAALSVSHGVKGSLQVGSAVAAVPVIASAGVALGAHELSGAVEDVMGTSAIILVSVAQDATDFASKKPVKTTELEITEITVTVDRSPKETVKSQQ